MEKTILTLKLWKEKAYLNGDFAATRKIAMELPGFRKFINDSLMLELSGKNIEYLMGVQEIVWDGAAEKFRDDYLKRQQHEQQMKIMKESAVHADAFDTMFKTKPFDHQKKAFLLSKDEEYYAYFMEMGTGKTKVVIDKAAYMYSNNQIECLVIIAPNGVHNQWINEQLPIHLPDWVDHEKATYKANSPKHLKDVARVLDAKQGLRIVAFNIESLSNKKGVEKIREFLQKYKCMIVLDESTRIKTPSSLRTKNALRVAGMAICRVIMSGAPITKGYEDLYTQLKFLHPDVLGFTSFYTFRNYHCIMGGFEQKQIVGYRPNAVKELEQKLDTYSFRTTKKECLDLPEKIYVKRYVELTPEQDKIYRDFEDNLLVQIDGKEVNVELAITQLLRMQQVICGHIVVGEKADAVIKDLPTNRLSVLLECIEEAAGKVIIWSRFTQDILKIEQELKKSKIGYVLYYGGVDDKDRAPNITKFRENASCKVFLAQPQSGGTGLNLAVASTVIYYSNDFNADTRWQSEDRAHRIGQRNNVTYIDLMAAKTIDEDIANVLMSKKNLADALLDNPRQFIKKQN